MHLVLSSGVFVARAAIYFWCCRKTEIRFKCVK